MGHTQTHGVSCGGSPEGHCALSAMSCEFCAGALGRPTWVGLGEPPRERSRVGCITTTRPSRPPSPSGGPAALSRRSRAAQHPRPCRQRLIVGPQSIPPLRGPPRTSRPRAREMPDRALGRGRQRRRAVSFCSGTSFVARACALVVWCRAHLSGRAWVHEERVAYMARSSARCLPCGSAACARESPTGREMSLEAFAECGQLRRVL